MQLFWALVLIRIVLLFLAWDLPARYVDSRAGIWAVRLAAFVVAFSIPLYPGMSEEMNVRIGSRAFSLVVPFLVIRSLWRAVFRRSVEE
jgi:hypothetical protein